MVKFVKYFIGMVNVNISKNKLQKLSSNIRESLLRPKKCKRNNFHFQLAHKFTKQTFFSALLMTICLFSATIFCTLIDIRRMCRKGKSIQYLTVFRLYFHGVSIRKMCVYEKPQCCLCRFVLIFSLTFRLSKIFSMRCICRRISNEDVQN